MKRRLGLAAVAVALVALAVATAFAWSSRRSRLVRVGGMGNACTCTQRIEP
ncbi:MAG: hypothetical protein ACXVAN_05945 [Polyangia bacterium]